MGEMPRISDICAEIIPRLVSFQEAQNAGFMNLPMLYPSGSYATVRITYAPGGIRVSDAGFAYREVESFGAGRSFAKTARAEAEKAHLHVGKRSIYVDVPGEEVERAILDVSAASCSVAQDIISRVSYDEEDNIEDILHERLDRIFPRAVEYERDVKGASSTDWKVTAIANSDDGKAIFQTVLNFPNAVYRASTAFHDIGALEYPPRLISVVSKKADMGKRYSILAQAGRVIEVSQSDDTYRRAVAA